MFTQTHINLLKDTVAAYEDWRASGRHRKTTYQVSDDGVTWLDYDGSIPGDLFQSHTYVRIEPAGIYRPLTIPELEYTLGNIIKDKEGRRYLVIGVGRSGVTTIDSCLLTHKSPQYLFEQEYVDQSGSLLRKKV